MSLKTELVEMKDALAALKERIEADDVEAIEEGVRLKADIEAKEIEIAQAEAKAAVLEAIGKDTNEEKKDMDGIKDMDLTALKGRRGTVSTYIKAASDFEATSTVYDYSRNVGEYRPSFGVRDLFARESISGNALTYYVMGEVETSGDLNEAVSEGAEKNQIHVVYTPTTAALDKLAAYLKESDELIEDIPYLESAIRTRGMQAFEGAVESYLISALAGTTGVQSVGTAVSFDTILQAKQDIRSVTGYAADAIVINPADLATLLQSKDDNGQYLLGGPAFGAYGNGSYNSNPRIWGLQVIESAAVPQGACIVGAFASAASVVTKAGEGLRVEISNSDQDDFIKNLVTVRIEERILLAVRRPDAFAIVGAEES